MTTRKQQVGVPKKLIEVALPLDAINAEAARSKRKAPGGYPTTLHCWWAQRPLAAARAVIFGQMVNDPSWRWEIEHPGEVPPSNLKASWASSRKRLFTILEQLVKWENTTNEEILERARSEILKSWRETCELNKDHPEAAKLFNPEKLPALHDPFAGSGAIPLEAQRLGLEAYASDLNPVAVLINKAVLEVPSKFSGTAPINPDWHQRPQAERLLRQWHGAQGLAEDVVFYGQRMRAEAHKRVGDLYPPIEITRETVKDRPELRSLIGQKLPVVAWLWARTVKSPNPAFSHVDVPLVSSFVLCSKAEKQVYVEPIISGDTYRFVVRHGEPPSSASGGTKAPGRGVDFRCLISNTPIEGDYIKREARAGRMSVRLMAVVASPIKGRGRIYLSPDVAHESKAKVREPVWRPDIAISGTTQYLGVKPYGMERFSDLFTNRQLVALNAFSDLIGELHEQIKADAKAAGMADDQRGLDENGVGATAYADAVAVYLALALDRVLDYGSTLATWRPKDSAMRSTMSRQALQMSWDFAEGSPFGSSSSGFEESIAVVSRVLDFLPRSGSAKVFQCDAQNQQISDHKVISTDPPYYDNVPYADLSDFFYVWLRRSLRPIFPELFATVGSPKAEELVAFSYRHEKGRAGAERFFLDGMTQAMHKLAEKTHPAFPITIYYAFKQSESEETGGTSSTGWETFLEGVLKSGLAVTGTWPVRTEGDNRQRGNKSNALASSIVLVCRKRAEDAVTVSRREFLRTLSSLLPEALDEMTRGAGGEASPVAPVDLSQAIIGPGMAAFSQYAAVLEADGTPMRVKAALQLINRFLAEDDFDHDTQFCLHWFEQHGWDEWKFGDADTLARAKGTSVDGVKQSGVIHASGGLVRLRKWSEYPADWEPANDTRLPVWEALHQLIRVFMTEGESGAGAVLAAAQAKAEATRQLAYRLYTLCERAGWAEDARAYNEIITSWSAIESAATKVPGPKQGVLFGG